MTIIIIWYWLQLCQVVVVVFVVSGLIAAARDLLCGPASSTEQNSINHNYRVRLHSSPCDQYSSDSNWHGIPLGHYNAETLAISRLILRTCGWTFGKTTAQVIQAESDSMQVYRIIIPWTTWKYTPDLWLMRKIIMTRNVEKYTFSLNEYKTICDKGQLRERNDHPVGHRLLKFGVINKMGTTKP